MSNASKTPNCSRVKAAESPLCPQVPGLYGLILYLIEIICENSLWIRTYPSFPLEWRISILELLHV